MGHETDYEEARRRARRIGESIYRAAALSPAVNALLRPYLHGEVGYLETLEAIVTALSEQYEAVVVRAVRAAEGKTTSVSAASVPLADLCQKCRERILQANLEN